VEINHLTLNSTTLPRT